MKKRLFSLMLALVLVFSLMPTPAFAEETLPAETEPVETVPAETEPVDTAPVETEPVETEPIETEPVETEPSVPDGADDYGVWGDNLTWKLEGTTLTISGKGEMDPEVYEESYYPWSIPDYQETITRIVIEDGVTTISDNAFSYFSALESVELPDTLEYIGYRAFLKCTSLTEIYLPDSLTDMSTAIFSACSSLTSARLPANLTHIPDRMFQSTALGQIEIPDTVVSIGENAFSSTPLKEVQLPDGLMKMGYGCFSSCKNLTHIEIPEGITALPQSGFSHSGLVSITLPSTLTDIGDNTFWFSDKLESIEIPEGVTHIGDRCFYNCTSLKSVTLPESLLEIEYGAFDSSGIVSLEIPAGITEIDQYTFRDCTALESLLIPDSVTKIGYDALANCPNLTVYTYQLSYAHRYADEYDIPVALLSDEPDTVYYPIYVHANDGGSVAIAPESSPANRYVFLEVAPSEGYYIDAIYYYLNTEEELELEFEQVSETMIMFLMPACEVGFEIYFNLTDSPFSDVKEGAYYYEPVLWAVSNNITSGVSANRFGPNNSCTRAQVVTFLWRAAGSPDPVNWNNPFRDVSEDAYYYKAVLWAVERGITSGVSADRFGPNNVCTRAQVVTFLWRAVGSPEPPSDFNPFTDVKETNYYYNAVLFAVQYGITSGVSDTTFGSGNTCTRAHVVTFLYKTFHG